MSGFEAGGKKLRAAMETCAEQTDDVVAATSSGQRGGADFGLARAR
ncbi:hypothetical protein AB0B45_28890 [Nonomuraea sp. NPDC049152]